MLYRRYGNTSSGLYTIVRGNCLLERKDNERKDNKHFADSFYFGIHLHDNGIFRHHGKPEI